LSIACVDLNRMDAEITGYFDGIMASHSLHHLVELEREFRCVKRVLRPGCVFAINDMIGRNGRMRWPEAAHFVQMLWPILGERQRYHAQLKRLYAEFEDWDCSSSGFEGVRAQDILPLLVGTFSPRRFFAGGGIVDPFIERGFGFGFDTARDDDRRLVHFICQLNDALLDNGQITPTLMLAHFYCEAGEEKFFRGRSAAASIRDPKRTPKWTEYFPPVPVLRKVVRFRRSHSSCSGCQLEVFAMLPTIAHARAEDIEIGARELPLECLRSAFEVALAVRQPLGDGLQPRSVVRGQRLAPHGREGDLDLIEPARVNRNPSAMGLRESPHRCFATMR
jgi:SAM-dependent methyltransferase